MSDNGKGLNQPLALVKKYFAIFEGIHEGHDFAFYFEKLLDPSKGHDSNIRKYQLKFEGPVYLSSTKMVQLGLVCRNRMTALGTKIVSNSTLLAPSRRYFYGRFMSKPFGYCNELQEVPYHKLNFGPPAFAIAG